MSEAVFLLIFSMFFLVPWSLFIPKTQEFVKIGLIFLTWFILPPSSIFLPESLELLLTITILAVLLHFQVVLSCFLYPTFIQTLKISNYFFSVIKNFAHVSKILGLQIIQFLKNNIWSPFYNLVILPVFCKGIQCLSNVTNSTSWYFFDYYVFGIPLINYWINLGYPIFLSFEFLFFFSTFCVVFSDFNALYVTPIILKWATRIHNFKIFLKSNITNIMIGGVYVSSVFIYDSRRWPLTYTWKSSFQHLKLFIAYLGMFYTGYELGQLGIFELNLSDYLDYLYNMFNNIFNSEIPLHESDSIPDTTSSHEDGKNNNPTTIFDDNDLENQRKEILIKIFYAFFIIYVIGRA